MQGLSNQPWTSALLSLTGPGSNPGLASAVLSLTGRACSRAIKRCALSLTGPAFEPSCLDSSWSGPRRSRRASFGASARRRSSRRPSRCGLGSPGVAFTLTLALVQTLDPQASSSPSPFEPAGRVPDAAAECRREGAGGGGGARGRARGSTHAQRLKPRTIALCSDWSSVLGPSRVDRPPPPPPCPPPPLVARAAMVAVAARRRAPAARPR